METQPAVVYFSTEPPQEVEINKLFQVAVTAEIKSGAALEKAVAKCNATLYFEQKDVSTNFFGGMASNSLTLEKTNSLTPIIFLDDS